MKNRRFGGFTLIELLVVIAIIAILAAILFPVFAKAREKARQSTCESNLKQIGIGMLAYTQDYDEQLVEADYGSGGYTQSQAPAVKYKWMDAIYPYVKSTAVFHCPDDPGWAGTGTYVPCSQLTTVDSSGSSNKYYGSYAINAAYWDTNSFTSSLQTTGPGRGHIASQLMQPAQTIWVADSNDSFEVDWGYQAPVLQNCFAGAGYCVGGGVTGASDGSLQDGSIQEVHGGPDLCNILWCDGHVKAMRLTQLLTTNSVGQLGYFTISGP